MRRPLFASFLHKPLASSMLKMFVILCLRCQSRQPAASIGTVYIHIEHCVHASLTRSIIASFAQTAVRRMRGLAPACAYVCGLHPLVGPHIPERRIAETARAPLLTIANCGSKTHCIIIIIICTCMIWACWRSPLH